MSMFKNSGKDSAPDTLATINKNARRGEAYESGIGGYAAKPRGNTGGESAGKVHAYAKGVKTGGDDSGMVASAKKNHPRKVPTEQPTMAAGATHYNPTPSPFPAYTGRPKQAR